MLKASNSSHLRKNCCEPKSIIKKERVTSPFYAFLGELLAVDKFSARLFDDTFDD